MSDNSRLTYIDSLRGIAVLLVVLVHVNQHEGQTWLINRLQSVGAMGVQLFFVISAFTLFLTSNGRLNTRSDVIAFYKKRFLRIAPMYYLACCYYFFHNSVFESFGGGNREMTVDLFLSNIFFVHGLRPSTINWLVPGGWTIAAEMLFYMVFPIVLYKIKNFDSAIKWGVIVLVSCTVVLKVLFRLTPDFCEKWEWDLFLFYSLPSQLPVFLFGVIAYFIVKSNKVSLNKTYLLVLVVILIVQLVFPNMFPPHYIFGCFFLLIIVILNKYPVKLIVNPILSFLGKMSYSIYLVHFAVFYWFSKSGLHSGLFNGFGENELQFIFNYIAVILTSVLISYGTYQLIEQPFIKLSKKRKSNLGLVNGNNV